MRTSKIVKCVDCGREYPRKELNRSGRCLSCGSNAILESMSQLMAHSGPYYEKWKQGIKAATEKL